MLPKIYIPKLVVVVSLGLILVLAILQYYNLINWKTIDFVLLGIGLVGFSVGVHVFRSFKEHGQWSKFLVIAILLLILLIGVDLAVGIFNSPWSGN